MFDQYTIDTTFSAVGEILDRLNNSQEGNHLIENWAGIVGKMFHRLTSDEGVPEEVAAAVIITVMQNLGEVKVA